MKKAQIWISAVLYTLIIVVAMTIVLTSIVPLVSKMRERAVFDKSKNQLSNLDSLIAEVASEGHGSQRTTSFEIQQGALKVKSGRIYLEMQSEAKLLEPRTSLTVGNLFMSSNADVNATIAGEKIILNNSRINIEFNKSATNISQIVSKMSMGAANLPNLPGGLKFQLNEQEFPAVVSVDLVPGEGTNLGRATVVAHTTNASVDAEFTLEGGADFLITNVDID